MIRSIVALATFAALAMGCSQGDGDNGPAPYASRYEALPSSPTLLTGATILTGTGERLDNADLVQRIAGLAEGTGLQVQGGYRLVLSDETVRANAMLAGLGSTRRVYLSDTLLDAFEHEEIEVVFAHELGHHTRRHIWKLLGLSAVFSTLHVAVLAYFLHPYHGSGPEGFSEAIALLPLIAVCLGGLSMILKPLHNAISRRFERQCDRDALRRTRNPQAYRSAMSRLAEMNLADPDPHPFIEWYFYDHPAIRKRIAMADEPQGG
ncbi:MAG: M48 family metalloprotease [Proteobacteria bacterium]|nr:M48 family metalloprotease [Pseudomonadota bacterium]